MKCFLIDAGIVLVLFLLSFYCGKILQCFIKPNEDRVEVPHFSLYDWNYSTAGDGSRISHVFGTNTDGDNAFIHIRGNEVYFCLYDKKYLTKTRKYSLTINGFTFSTEIIQQKQSLKIKRSDAFIGQLYAPQFKVSIYTNNRFTETYDFNVGEVLRKINIENLAVN